MIKDISTETNAAIALGKRIRSKLLATGNSKIDISTDKYKGTNIACPSINIKTINTNDSNCIQSFTL